MLGNYLEKKWPGKCKNYVISMESLLALNFKFKTKILMNKLTKMEIMCNRKSLLNNLNKNKKKIMCNRKLFNKKTQQNEDDIYININ